MVLLEVVGGDAALLGGLGVVELRDLLHRPLLGVLAGRLAAPVEDRLSAVGVPDQRHEERLGAGEKELDLPLPGGYPARVLRVSQGLRSAGEMLAELLRAAGEHHERRAAPQRLIKTRR